MFPECTTLFLTEKVYNNLDKDIIANAHIRLYNKTKPLSSFIENIDTSEFDYIFVNTIQPSMIDLPKWKHFNPSCPSILTIHNINAWTKKGPYLRKNILHSADSFVSSFYVDRILNKFRYINVVNESLMLHAVKSFPNRSIISIPFSVTTDTINRNEKETIDFVIPGTVDSRRRDYETILDVFGVLRSDFKNIRLILLGKTEENIMQKGVITFNDFVPNDVYDTYLSNADFIMCPCHEKTHTVNTASEYYGVTKSPNFFEAVKWKKPLFLPSKIPFPKAIKNMIIPYSDYEGLYNSMKFFLNKEVYSKLLLDVEKSTEYFTVDNVRRRISQWIEKI